MIFRDKPLSVMYFEECLINPPVFPGSQDITTYLNKVHLLSLGGFESRSEISERVGEVLGSLATRMVLATCILEFRTQLGSRREIRALNTAMELLGRKASQYSDTAWSVGNHTLGGELDSRSIAIGMAKSNKILAYSTQPDFILEYEMNVASHLADFRYQIMRNFSPSFLREKLWEGIEEITGIVLDSSASPID